VGLAINAMLHAERGLGILPTSTHEELQSIVLSSTDEDLGLFLRDLLGEVARAVR
jgi:hypothetical protein